MGLGSEVDLHVSEVPVEYQTVQSLVPSLWKQYRPLVRDFIHRLSCLHHSHVGCDFNCH